MNILKLEVCSSHWNLLAHTVLLFSSTRTLAHPIMCSDGLICAFHLLTIVYRYYSVQCSAYSSEPTNVQCEGDISKTQRTTIN